MAPGPSPSEVGALQRKVDFPHSGLHRGKIHLLLEGEVLSRQSFSSRADSTSDTLGTFCEDLKPCLSVVWRIFGVGG